MSLSSSKPHSLKSREAKYAWTSRAMASYDEARSDESSPWTCVGRASAMDLRTASTLRGGGAVASAMVDEDEGSLRWDI